MTMLFALIVMATMIPAALLLGHLPLTFAQCAKRYGNQYSRLAALLRYRTIYRNARLRQGGHRPRKSHLRADDAHLRACSIRLPKFLRTISPIWPTYHLQQLVFAALGMPSYGKTAIHVAVLAGVTDASHRVFDSQAGCALAELEPSLQQTERQASRAGYSATKPLYNRETRSQSMFGKASRRL